MEAAWVRRQVRCSVVANNPSTAPRCALNWRLYLAQADVGWSRHFVLNDTMTVRKNLDEVERPR